MSIVFTLRSSCELETYIVAVERMKEYSEQENEVGINSVYIMDINIFILIIINSAIIS